jgi:2-keto-4-pentenoate hydratase/2-oxohepta-3-ene-1,7-dioic acid hydratase in catechol pathway
MKIVSFGNRGEERPGVLLDTSTIVDLPALEPDLGPTWRNILTAGALPRVRDLLTGSKAPPDWALIPLESTRLGPPIPDPSKIVCLGLNYLDHAREQGRELPETPLLFAKAPSSLSGPRDPIILPAEAQHVDFEAELALVVGRRARSVSADQAYDYIAGYMALNDVSERRLQKSERQWFRAKSFDSFAPCGPCMVTCDELPDPHALAIQGELNGERLQDSTTGEMARRIPQLMEFISGSMTLEPGDIVSTGTPAGVGVFRDPKIFMKAGDEVVIRIEGIGELRSAVEQG